MANFQQTVESLLATETGYAFDVPDEWSQGRTLFGGMTAALSYRAVQQVVGDLGPLRSAQFTFIGPACGRLSFRPHLLRRGRSSSIVSVDAGTEEGLAARAMFVFGGARDSTITHDFTPGMAVPPPESCAPFHKTTRSLPGFLSKFEFRLAAGSRLFEPRERPEFAVWTRLRDGDGPDPLASLLALADALPCAAMANFPKPAAVSTVTWAVDLHWPLKPHFGWHLIWSASESAAEGYSLQNMRVYDQAGDILLSGRQRVAVFI